MISACALRRLVRCFLIAVLVGTLRGHAIAQEPDVRGFAAAFNAGSDALDRYVREHLVESSSPQDLRDTVETLRALRAAVGTITVARVNELPRRIVATVKSAAGAWYSVALIRARGGAPDKYDRIMMNLGLPLTTQGESPDAYLSSIGAQGYFSGAAIIAKDRAPVVAAAYGQANRERGIANTTSTTFNVGSIGKLFTTCAIYQLIEKGTLRPNDTIGRWLPDYPNREARAVTIAQLLTMRSGIGDFFGPRFFQGHPERIRGLRDYLPFFARDPLAFKPGSREMYSNGGFIVLGLIVEKASRQDFYAYVKEHIFAPAGMSDSAYPTLDQSAPNRADGYTRQWSDVVTYQTPLRKAHGQPGRGSSAGGAYSTVGDLLKFTHAIQNGTLVRGKYQWNSPGNFYVGGTPGWNAAIDMEDDFTIIVLENQDPPAAENLATNLLQLAQQH
jgi:CubicO group peptidase (beta-lactamase class C family)